MHEIFLYDFFILVMLLSVCEKVCQNLLLHSEIYQLNHYYTLCIVGKVFILLFSFFCDWEISGAGFTKPPLERTSFNKGRLFFCLWQGHLKTQFHKALLTLLP